MLIKRKANDRGEVNWSWLKTRHSFSFGSYFDPKWMGFKNLRVINDDLIDEARGFETHPHRDMEILSFVISGAIEHKDTMGNHSVIRPGEIQVMSAGTGIEHSEFNPNKDQKTHMLQIWIEPNIQSLKPSYQDYKYQEKPNELTLLASGSDESVAKIHQDVEVFLGSFENISKQIELSQKHSYWLHCYEGSALVNTEVLEKGDGVGIEKLKSLDLEVSARVKFLLFKLS